MRTLEASAPQTLTGFTIQVIVAGVVTETIVMANIAAEGPTWQGTIANALSVGFVKLNFFYNGSAVASGRFYAEISADDGSIAYARDYVYTDAVTTLIPGARTVLVTVTDGLNNLEGALVRLTQGAQSFVSITDVNGLAVLNVNDATYRVAITNPGYSFPGATLNVNQDEQAVTYEMDLIIIQPPASPSSTTGMLITLGIDNQPEANVVLYFGLRVGPGTPGYSYVTEWFPVASQVDGLLSYNGFARLTKYVGKRGPNGDEVEFTTPDADSFNLPEILGYP